MDMMMGIAVVAGLIAAVVGAIHLVARDGYRAAPNRRR
jgi:hypothetical protein